MKNIKSTKNVNTPNKNEGYALGSGKDAREGFMSDAIASKAFTAWAVEIDGEIDATDIRPTRAWARADRSDFAEFYGSDAKVSVRKVLIVPVSDR